MDFGVAISTTVAVILTLCIFSFLYRDNPFYKFAEHLVVGVSAGYWVAILYINVAIPNIWLVIGPSLMACLRARAEICPPVGEK